jgi:ArsR family transcriptional regulator, arsenate/arsenite/antimonite-responsive transcriptional repressor
MTNEYKNDAKIFKAFCDEKRLQILKLLKNGEKCACILIEEMNMGQSALSYHMKILCESNIVKARQDGKWTHYSINAEGSKYALKRLMEITDSKKGNSSCCK